MKYFFIFLLVSFIFLAGADMYLTNIALDNNFYETNEFTNKTSLEIHFFILTLSVSLISLFGLFFITPNFVMGFLIVLNIVWLINNIISLNLLRGLLWFGLLFC